MVACIVNFAVGAKDTGSDLGSSIGYTARNLFHLFAIVLIPFKVLYLHYATLLLALVQVKIFVVDINTLPITPLLDPSTMVT